MRLRGYQPVDEHEFVLNFGALLPGYEVTGFRRLHGYRIAKSSTYLAISTIIEDIFLSAAVTFTLKSGCSWI